MADACVCSDKLFVDESGRLCLVEGSTGLQAIMAFTSSGAFAKASFPWLARVHVLVVGGGGGGGGANAHSSVQVSAGGGGASGGAAEKVVEAVALAASETVTVGAGGAGATGAGAAGSPSSFGAHAVAGGGAGGVAGSATGAAASVATGGSGAAGTVGDVLYQGGDGYNGIARGPDQVNIAIGGAGGGSALWPSVWTNMVGVGISAGLDPDYQNKGFGGSGGASFFSQGGSAQRGGDGSDGLVVVRLFA